MRYLVKATLKPGRENALKKAIADQSLGRGSIAEDEYLKDMAKARQLTDGTVTWVEVCFCKEPLAEEKPFWEEYFQITSVKNAHSRNQCKDLTGEKPWHCTHCDCTQKLESKMEKWGHSFQKKLFKF